MPVYRTAQGKPLDMSQLVAKNEKVRAVGNMNVNARGDVLDSHNRVIRDNTKRVKSQYQNVVKQRPQQPSASQPVQQAPVSQPVQEIEELSEAEKEMFDDLDDEEIKK